MEFLGIGLTTWIAVLGILVVALLAWKIIKFAFKIFLVIVVAALILFGLDYVGVFDTIQNLISSFM